MTTIATDILRDYEHEVGNLQTTREAEEPGLQATPYLLMLRLCEQAQGTRIGYHEWVFPDGSQLLM